MELKIPADYIELDLNHTAGVCPEPVSAQRTGNDAWILKL